MSESENIGYDEHHDMNQLALRRRFRNASPPPKKESPMIDEVIGYAAAWKGKDGKTNFISTDHQSGYLSWSEGMRLGDVGSLASAVSRVENSKGEMRTYFNHEKVDFDSIQVVEVRAKSVPAILVDERLQQELINKFKSNFNEAEIEVLRNALAK